MGVVISPDSALGIELRRWDTPRNQNVRDSSDNDTGVRGMRAVGYEPYPRMLYKAREIQGRAAIDDPTNESFAQGCQKVVHSEQEHRIANGDGWCEGPVEAIQAYEAKQKAWSDEAANAAYHAARMSEKARAEYQQASDQTHEHVVDVRARKKPGRKPKIAPVSVTAED